MSEGNEKDFSSREMRTRWKHVYRRVKKRDKQSRDLATGIEIDKLNFRMRKFRRNNNKLRSLTEIEERDVCVDMRYRHTTNTRGFMLSHDNTDKSCGDERWGKVRIKRKETDLYHQRADVICKKKVLFKEMKKSYFLIVLFKMSPCLIRLSTKNFSWSDSCMRNLSRLERRLFSARK